MSEAPHDPVPLLDLRAQYAPLAREIDDALRGVVETQAFILGPPVEALEREIAELAGVEHAIACASGTDALILSLAALDIGAADEVLTSPFSFFSTASCAYKVGARPRFADIDPRTFNLDPDAVREALGPRTRALLPVHLFGQCADMTALGLLAERAGLAVVEDAAQALGASWDGRAAGALGRTGCYSFFPSKNLGCFGDGGMVVTRDEPLAERLRLLRVHGGRQMYHHRWVGWNSRLDALQAAVLRVKLPHLAAWSAGRRANADAYDEAFTALGLVATGELTLPFRDPRATHIFNQYTLRARRRDELREHLARHGIGHAVYYPVPLHLQECFAELGYRRGQLPRAERAAEEVISLPVYPELTGAQRGRVIEAVAGFYGRAD